MDSEGTIKRASRQGKERLGRMAGSQYKLEGRGLWDVIFGGIQEFVCAYCTPLIPEIIFSLIGSVNLQPYVQYNEL